METICDVCSLSIIEAAEQAPKYFRDREIGIVFSQRQHDACHRKFADEKTGFEVLAGPPSEIPERMRERHPSAAERRSERGPSTREPSEGPVIHISGPNDMTFQFGRSKIIPPRSMPQDKVFRQLRARPGKPKAML